MHNIFSTFNGKEKLGFATIRRCDAVTEILRKLINFCKHGPICISNGYCRITCHYSYKKCDSTSAQNAEAQ